VTTAVVVACLLLAAVVLAWPGRGVRSRLRATLPAGARAVHDRTPGRRPATPGWRLMLGRRAALLQRRPAGSSGRAVVPALAVLAVVVIAGAAGGVVAALAVAAYGTAAARALLAGAAQRARAQRRRELLDHLACAASDLRAGLPTGAVLPAGSPVGSAIPAGPRAGAHRTGDDRLSARVGAATGLAERTGAPLAEVLDRIEADARAADRARAAAAAQAAGARATAGLLAALPAGGLALGYLIGADPLAVLLHTPVGAACALAAVALQVAGLAWTRRIMRGAGAVS
jgi:tight adherence protein B